MGKVIGAAEFKAHCLRIMKEVQNTGEMVTVTHRGVPVVRVTPVEQSAKPKGKLEFGFMKGFMSSDLDPEASAYGGPWNAELDSDELDPGADVR